MMKHGLPVLLLLALASCGTLPQPFRGNPGPQAARLAVPPAPVLMVPTPKAADLPPQAAALFAQDLADQLAENDVPTVAGPPLKQGWTLAVSAHRQDKVVVPDYVVTGPNGKTYGQQMGAPVPVAAWQAADAATLQEAASVDATPLARLMAQINARIQRSNPESLENRPARLYVGPVTGAPGDGDSALPLNLKRDLPGADDVLADTPEDADFTVTGHIKTSPAKNGQVLVELDWVVRDTNNRVVGRVTQLHDLSPHDIAPYWGDVAAAAAQEAASGIQQVVQNAVLKKAKAAK